MTGNDKTEAQCAAPQRAGDCVLPLSEAVCSRLVSLHGSMVKAACGRILRDPALAEDTTQEVFLLLVRKLPSLPPRTILGGWLYVTACHASQNDYARAAANVFTVWNLKSESEAAQWLQNSSLAPAFKSKKQRVHKT